MIFEDIDQKDTSKEGGLGNTSRLKYRVVYYLPGGIGSGISGSRHGSTATDPFVSVQEAGAGFERTKAHPHDVPSHRAAFTGP